MAAGAAHAPIDPDRLAKLRGCIDVLGEARTSIASLLASSDSSSSDSTEWRFEKEVLDGVKAFSRPEEGTNLRKFLAVGDIEAPAEFVAGMLWDSETRLSWDVSYDTIDVFTHGYSGLGPDQDAKLVRLAIKPVLIVAARDFCMLQMRKDNKEDGSILAVAYSVVEDDVCPPRPGFVRGDVLPGSSWHLQPVNGREKEACTLTYCIFTDIKGWVPQWAVNAAVTDTFSKYYTGIRGYAAAHWTPGKDGAAGETTTK